MAEAVSSWMTYTAAQNGLVALNRHFANNKVIVLFKDRRWVIFNEDKGDWVDGVWYSNSAWKDTRGWNSYNPAPRVTPACATGIVDRSELFEGAYHMGVAHRHGMYGAD